MFFRRKAAVAACSLVAIVSWSTALLTTTVAGSMGTGSGSLQGGRQSGASVSGWERRPEPEYIYGRRAGLLGAVKANQGKILGVKAYSPGELSTEQAVDLAKPGVVSIINWLDGSISIPDFDVDLETLALTPRSDLPAFTMKTEWNVYGSGFAVNPDGYIITNAHVVSKDSVFSSLAEEVKKHWDDLFQDALSAMSDDQYFIYEAYLKDKFGGSQEELENSVMSESVKSIDAYIKAQAKDNVTQKLAVIDKSQKHSVIFRGSEIEQVFKSGLPAELVSFFSDYLTTGKDVAMVKIAEKNIPALAIGSSEGLTSGSKVFIMGFPYNAQINQADLFEPTLTQGIISAVKEHEGQKVFQLDGKISTGSSGGPVLDSHGRVIGILTYKQGSAGQGDDFGFALPVELAKEIMEQKSVKNELGVYGDNLLAGYASQDERRCKEAIAKFEGAKGVNSRFLAEEILNARIGACQDIIAAGNSKDGAWDAFRDFYSQNRTYAYVFFAIVLALLIFGISLIKKLIIYLRAQEDLWTAMPPAPHLKI